MPLRRVAIFILLLITLVWGTTFPLIKLSISRIPPFSFIAARFWIGALVLFVISMIQNKQRSQVKHAKESTRAGVLLGLVLFAGLALQTFGLGLTSASNAGFLTSLFVVIVPLLQLRRGKSIGPWTVTGVLLSVGGAALLTLQNGLQMGLGDLLVLGCALTYSLQIEWAGEFSTQYDPSYLGRIQIYTCAILSTFFALFFERSWLESPAWSVGALGSLIFCGIVATALAFQAQIHYQRYVTATQGSLIYSIEPVFAFLFSASILGETLSTRQAMGGGLMVIAAILSEAGPWLTRYKKR